MRMAAGFTLEKILCNRRAGYAQLFGWHVPHPAVWADDRISLGLDWARDTRAQTAYPIRIRALKAASPRGRPWRRSVGLGWSELGGERNEEAARAALAGRLDSAGFSVSRFGEISLKNSAHLSV